MRLSAEFMKPTDLHCPGCGKKAVFVEQGEGDYHVGPTHLCVACSATFYLPLGCEASDREVQENKPVVDELLANHPTLQKLLSLS